MIDQLSSLRLNFGLYEVLLWAAIVVGSIAYRVVNAAGWPMILRALGSGISYRQGVQLWLIGESGRWLPGGVWGYGARLWLVQNRAAVPLPAAAASISLELVLTVAAWAIVATAGVCWDLRLLTSAWPKGGLPAHALWPIIAGTLSLVGLSIFLVRRLLQSTKVRAKVLSLVRGLKAAREGTFHWKGLVGTLGLYCVLAALNGAVLWMLVMAVGGQGNPGALPLVIGANAIAWIAGFLAIAAPGGLGVREAALAACLSLVYPAPVAIGAAVLWRVVQIGAELLCLALVTGTFRLGRELPSPTISMPEEV